MKFLITTCLFTFVLGQNLNDISTLSSPNVKDFKEFQDRFDQELVNSSNLKEEDQKSLSNVKIINSNKSNLSKSKLFGYNYFRRDISFFDNLPTPSNYLLGPGDEIIVSMWGENNSRESYIVNKDGMIFYENVGFISLSNLTLLEAENLLVEKLSNVFSTLQSTDNPTNLNVELGKLKSINIYITGQANNPGINLIHPFSNIFSALVQSGGIKNEGSLRQIKHIRNGEIIQNIDFYQLFINGVYNFNQENLIDGDIIHVPVVEKRVEINGEVKLPFSFELLPREQLSDLVEFAGGFSSDASNYIIIDQVIPMKERKSEDNAKTSINLLFSESKSTKLNNGDKVKVLPIKGVKSKVEIFGRVKNPGKYSAVNSTLKDILDLAGGFDDPVYRKTIDEKIIVMRLDENQYYSQQFEVMYSDSENFELKVNDNIFIYEIPDYYNSLFYTIEGEVNRPGTYTLVDGITLRDAINNAGGLTQMGSINSVSIKKSFEVFDENEEKISSTELVTGANFDFIISDRDIIQILPKTNVVKVSGNVYNPGLVAFSGSKMKITQVIEKAGGFKPYTLKKNIYVVRTNGEIEKIKPIFGKGMKIYPGDSIFVPGDPDPNEFDITSFISDLSSTLANIAAILLIVDNSNN